MMPKWILCVFFLLPFYCFGAQGDFDLLMGQDTPAWQHCKTAEDFRRLKFFNNLFQKNILLGRADEAKIPKVIHFIWLGSDPIPKESVGRVRKWVELHPDWTFKFWTDIERGLPHPKLEGVLPPNDLSLPYYEAVDLEKKATILAFEILSCEGGLYVDLQTTPFCSFDLLHEQYDFFCGLKTLGITTFSSSVMPSPHLMGARPGHPILLQTQKGLETAGPDIAFASGIDFGIDQEGSADIVFPSSYFSGKHRKASSFAAHLSVSQESYTPFERKVEGKFQSMIQKENGEIRFLLILVAISLASLITLVIYARKVLLLLLLCCTLQANGSEEFYKHMGKEIDHWDFVASPEEVLTLEKFASLYERSKHLRFSQEGDYRIPQVIHFIWLGPNPFPPQSVENVRSWMAHHPDWTVKFWTDRERLLPCNDMEVCQVEDFSFRSLGKCFAASENWGEKSDVLRFEILGVEGGVYVDHDANCLQKFDGIHRGYDFYCGLEVPHPLVAGKNITSGNGIIGAKANHPVIDSVIEKIGQGWNEIGNKYRGKDGYSRTQLVMERTYIRLTEALSQELCESGNNDIVFPASYFFAKKGIRPLYSRHFFANSWADNSAENQAFKNKTNKALNLLQKRNHTIRQVARFSLCLNLIAQAGIFLYLLKKKRVRI